MPREELKKKKRKFSYLVNSLDIVPHNFLSYYFFLEHIAMALAYLPWVIHFNTWTNTRFRVKVENSTLFSLPCLSSPFFFLISIARVGDRPPLLTQIGVLGDTVIFLEKTCSELSVVKLLCQAEQTEEESAHLPSFLCSRMVLPHMAVWWK